MTNNLPDNALADELAAAMADAWGEICDDTGCHPLDIRREGRKLFFERRHWVDLIALRLSERLSLRRSPPAGEAVEHARCSTCGATDPRDPDKWYCSNGFHAPSPVEAGILALLRFHRSQVHYTHQSRNEVAGLDAAIDALTRLGVGVDGGWQPIETAPKDGSTILIYSTDGDEYSIDTAVWNNGIWALACNPMNALGTHWRPLPSPPSPSPESAPTDSMGEG